MKNYSELIKARFENITGVLTTVARGLIYFKTDGVQPDRPVIDDGTDVTQVMMEKHLAEARRTTKVQLDDTVTGNEVLGVLPVAKGGLGVIPLTGEAGKFIQVNGTETGYVLANTEKEVIVDTKAAIDALTRQQGLFYYATDEDAIYTDDGTNVNPLQVDLGEGYWFRETSVDVDADGVIAELAVTGLTIGKKYKVTVTARCKRQTTAQQEIQTITFSAVPDEGDWSIDIGGETANLMGWDATAADVEAQLEALPSIGAGNILVSGDFTTGFQITGNFAGFNDLAQATIPVNTLAFGGVGGVNEVQRVTFSGTPTSGSFTITFDGQTTAAIPYNATATQVKDALELLPNINGVTVTDI
jgi:hypothetical protein